MAWFLNPALTRFRQEVNAHWPGRDKKSDGTIGDLAHQATNSDHNPDGDGSVDAWDMDNNGVDVNAVIAAALKHESIQYVIWNRRITSRSWGLGTWRAYDGPSPHTEHVHFNTRPSHENSTKPWFTTNVKPLPLEDDMDQAEFNGLMNTYVEQMSGLNGTSAAQQRIRRNWTAVVGVNDLSVAVAAGRLEVGQVDESVVAGLSTLLVPAIVAAVTAAVGDVPAEALQEAVEAGVRNVLGGLNDAPPVEG